MAITAAATTAMREVALPRQGDAMAMCMATKRVDARSKTLAPEQLLNSLPALGLRYGAKGGTSHAGLMEMPEERRETAGMDAREAGPSGIGTHERGEAPPVVSAALAMAEGAASVESAGGAEKATAAKSEALNALKPGAYGEAGSRRERPLHGGAWAALSNQLESALELSRSLQARDTTARNTISILEVKVNALKSLVHGGRS